MPQALANAQWEAGRLDGRIKDRALALIEEGVDFRWRRYAEHRDGRLAVLHALREKLLRRAPSPMPADELGE
jgi:hypothetical protein